MNRRSYRNLIWYVVGLPLSVVLLTEAGLRFLAYRPYQSTDFSIKSQPAFWLIPDSSLGFALNPGSYEVTINSKLRFKTDHGKNGERELPLIGLSLYDLGFFGCSFTYGWGLNNDECYPALLQSKIPNIQIKNHAVPGYGSVQGYLQIKHQIEQDKQPDLAIFAYMPFHDQRNSMSASYRQGILQGYAISNPKAVKQFGSARFPYAKISGDSLSVHYLDWSERYAHWPLRKHSALINLIQNSLEARQKDEFAEREITLQILKESKSICEQNDIGFVIFCLSNDAASKEAASLFRNEGFTVWQSDIDLYNDEWTFHPVDDHPNEKAHRKLADYLEPLVLEEVPEREKFDTIPGL